jgi:hypothetical protein
MRATLFVHTVVHVRTRWARQYALAILEANPGNDKYAKYLQLLKADTLNKCDNIIGNTTWTQIKCDGCEKYYKKVMIVGEEPDYESATVRLCRKCCELLPTLWPN